MIILRNPLLKQLGKMNDQDDIVEEATRLEKATNQPLEDIINAL